MVGSGDQASADTTTRGSGALKVPKSNLHSALQYPVLENSAFPTCGLVPHTTFHNPESSCGLCLTTATLDAKSIMEVVES